MAPVRIATSTANPSLFRIVYLLPVWGCVGQVWAWRAEFQRTSIHYLNTKKDTMSSVIKRIYLMPFFIKTSPAAERRGWFSPLRPKPELLHVSGSKLGHLKHRHFALAAEDGLKLLIREDVPLVGRILEVVLLDVLPHLLHHLAPGHRSFAHYCLEFRRHGHGPKECRIRSSFHNLNVIGN